jgi:hypothetical protein
VLKDFRSEHEDKFQNQLTCQGSFFSSVTKFSLSHLSKVWSTAQSKLPKNIYNFTMRCINNSLPTSKNLSRWGLSSSSECSFCLGPESLLHVVAGCQCYLDRFTWRHNSILNFLANTLANCERFCPLRWCARIQKSVNNNWWYVSPGFVAIVIKWLSLCGRAHCWLWDKPREQR